MPKNSPTGMGHTQAAPGGARVATSDRRTLASGETQHEIGTVRIEAHGQRRATEPAVVMSIIARAVTGGSAVTRPQLVEATSLARTTIETNLGLLIAGGVVVEGGASRQSRYGRPASLLALSADVGVVLVAEVTPHHLRLVVADMTQAVRATSTVDHPIGDGPDASVAVIDAGLDALLASIGLDRRSARVLVVSVPGPVDVHRGVPVRPPIMPGWDEFPLAEALRSRLHCPVLVDNDVNLMALGESRALPTDQLPLLLVKVGTGIGGGIVAADGEVFRGADGAAGDIGHIRAHVAEDVVCTCGNVDCVEAVASLEAMARKLTGPDGRPGVSQESLLELLRSGDGTATRLVRDAATSIGGVVATLVHCYNPARVALAGRLTSVSDDLLAGVRSAVYRRALPLATRNLTIAHSVLGADSGIVGGLVLGIEYALGPDRIQDLVRDRLESRR